MPKNYKFSILMPAYNVENYIENSIRSVLKQTYDNWELIIIDDGSTDYSGDISDRIAKEDDRLSVFHIKNGGLMHARRYALSKASGDIMLALDSDDSLESNALEILNDTFMSYDTDCVIFGFRCNNGSKVIFKSTEDQVSHLSSKREIYLKCLEDRNYNAIWRKAYRRDVLDNRDYSQFYHIKHGEDLLQSIEVLENSQGVTFIPNILYNYTYNPDSMTRTRTFENYKVDYTVREEVLKMLKREKTITEEDMCRYRNICYKQLIATIGLISRFSTTNQKKIELLQKHRESNYIQTFLDTKNNRRGLDFTDRLILDHFFNNKFKTVLRIFTIYNLIKEG